MILNKDAKNMREKASSILGPVSVSPLCIPTGKQFPVGLCRSSDLQPSSKPPSDTTRPRNVPLRFEWAQQEA